MKLTERKKDILQEVVIRFIKSADPVSSQSIAENTDLNLSPATIRKEMAELEEMGYLTRPHTSAGRVPTDRGYRYYVDNIIPGDLRAEVGFKKNIPPIKFAVDKDMEIESILQKSSELLAEFTKYLSMIIAPNIHQSRFRHVELLKFQERNFLMVLITNTGRVYKRNFLLEGSYNSLDLQRVANILNSQLRGQKIINIDIENIKIPESDAYLVLLIKKIIVLIKSCEEEQLYNRVFVHGAYEFLQQPEFIDLKKMKDILGIIEDDFLLMRLLLNLSYGEEFTVKIGSEMHIKGIDDLSLVASKYKVCGNSTGAIGVLGPKRMDYHKVISILNIFKEYLSDTLDFRT